MDKSLLLIDRNDKYASILSEKLKTNGFDVLLAHNGKNALELARQFRPSIVLMDIDFDDMDAFEICAELRSNIKFEKTYIVFFTEKSDAYLQIAALENGADDFLTKNISDRLLLMKMESFYRRVSSYNVELDSKAKSGKIKIDFNKYLAIVDEKEIELPKMEFEILSLLFSVPGKVFSRSEIKASIWKKKKEVKQRTIDVHVKKLRDRIGGNYIKTIKGLGYKLVNNT